MFSGNLKCTFPINAQKRNSFCWGDSIDWSSDGIYIRFRKQECTVNKQNAIAEHEKELRTDGTKPLGFFKEELSQEIERCLRHSSELQVNKSRKAGCGPWCLEKRGWKKHKNWFFVCFRRESPQWAKASSLTRFLDHTQLRTTVGRTTLDDWSARRRDLYWQHTHTHTHTHTPFTTETSMPQVRFEPTISAG